MICVFSNSKTKPQNPDPAHQQNKIRIYDKNKSTTSDQVSILKAAFEKLPLADCPITWMAPRFSLGTYLLGSKVFVCTLLCPSNKFRALIFSCSAGKSEHAIYVQDSKYCLSSTENPLFDNPDSLWAPVIIGEQKKTSVVQYCFLILGWRKWPSHQQSCLL